MKFREIDIEFIAEIRKKNRFIRINKHVFELFFEQEKWLHYQMLIDFEIIELKWKNDRFVKKVNRISKRFQIK